LCVRSGERIRGMPCEGIVGAVVQATYSGAVKSLLVNFKEDACQAPSSKFLDRETDSLGGERKSSVPHVLSA
jgi:hypothetical protein